MADTPRRVTAVVIAHQNKPELLTLLENLKQQTRPVDEVILCVCCMDASDIVADIKLLDIHRDDIGQSKCDMGLRLSTGDYTFLASSDDEYHPEFIERLLGQNTDLILSGFHSHLVGEVAHSEPIVGRVTRGSFLVNTRKAVEVGYNHRNYEGDGLFIEDMVKAGASWSHVPEVLYYHR